MSQIYYIETNLICIIILIMLLHRLHYSSSQQSEAGRIFNYLIWSTMSFCVFDMLAGINRGLTFNGARQIIEISNLLYFEALVIISYLWYRYVLARINKDVSIISTIPIVVFALIAISNPITNILFSINKDNLYVRGSGVAIHWIVTWGYLITATLIVIKTMYHESNKIKRREYKPLLRFIIAPTIASLIQMFCYGVTCSQVGITISIMIIYLSIQSGLVLTDSLTGLNNRRGFDRYLNDYIIHSSNLELTLMMIDLNNFKAINDTYGHKSGDDALYYSAQVIKEIFKDIFNRSFLCRYGGDEFVIALISDDKNEIEKIVKDIHFKLKNKSNEMNLPYTISASIGIATGKCSSFENANELLHQADKYMYENKKEYKKKFN